MLLPRSTKNDRTAKELAPGVSRIDEFAPVINACIVDDVLIDSGRRWDRKRIFKALEGRDISLVALTRAHGDHNGVAKDVCEAWGVPLAVHAGDVAVMERGGPTPEELAEASAMARLVWRYWGGPAHRVGRVLEEGDEVAGFRIIHAPGPQPGRGDLLPRVRSSRDLRRRDPQPQLRDPAAEALRAAGGVQHRHRGKPALDPQAGRARAVLDPAGARRGRA